MACFLRRFINAPRRRSRKPIVEIHVDQRRVGELTPQMSQRFLPIIQHFEKRGLTSACRAQITSSSLAAEVRICAVPLLSEISAPYS